MNTHKRVRVYGTIIKSKDATQRVRQTARERYHTYKTKVLQSNMPKILTRKLFRMKKN